VGLLVLETLLFIFPLHFLDLVLETPDLTRQFVASVFKCLDLCLHLVLALLTHKGFAHTESDAGLVKLLVSINCHDKLVTAFHKKEASLSTVNRDLSDDFIEALSIELFTNWADTGCTGTS